MSQISDVGVAFRMQGADSFENQLKSLENQWKSFSGSFNQTPQINKYFDKMTSHIGRAEKQINKSLGLIKAGVLGVLAVKGGNKVLDYLVGNEATSDARSFNVATMGAEQREKYIDIMKQLHSEHKISMEDLEKGTYQIDTAMSGKPIKQSIGILETLPYYMKLTGKSFEESAKFVKQFYASFGDSLPAEKHATYAKDTLGQLMAVAKVSKSDPQQVLDALGRLGSLYSSMGFSQAELFSDITSLTPKTGNSPERASTAISTLLPRSSEIATKIAQSDYEQAFSTGRAVDERGVRSRDYGSLANLKDAAAAQDQQAMKDLAEMQRNSGRYGEKAALKAEQFLKQHDRHGLMNYLAELVEKNKSNPLAQKVLRDALGEHANSALAWLDDFRRGEIKRLESEYNKSSGDQAIKDINTAQSRELPHQFNLVKQGAEQLSVNMRSVFYEPMLYLLEEWKAVFTNINSSFTGENGAKKLKAIGGAIVDGHRDVVGPGGLAGDSRSLGQMFQDFVTSLNPQDFRDASRTLSQAAKDFSSVVGMFRTVITQIHQQYNKMFPQVSGAPKENERDILWGAFRYNPDKGILPWLRRGAPIDENYLPKAAPQSDMLMPAHKSTPMLAPPASNGSSAGTGGLSSLNITSQPQVTVNIDDRAIKDAVKVEVRDEIKEDLLRDQSRNRGNSLDQSLMATN